METEVGESGAWVPMHVLLTKFRDFVVLPPPPVFPPEQMGHNLSGFLLFYSL